MFNASSASNFQLNTLCIDPDNLTTKNYNPITPWVGTPPAWTSGMPTATSISAYDANLNLRASTDAIGAVAKGYANPSRAF